jgi:hypothetical protein
MRQELMTLRTRYDEARRQALDEASERTAAERRHEESALHWSRAIAERDAELVAMSEHMAPPRDLEVLRDRIRAEVEGPCLARIAALEAEGRRLKEALAAAQRETQVLAAEHAGVMAEQARAFEAQQSQHREAEGRWQRAVASLHTQLDDAARDSTEALKQSRQALASAEGRNRALEAEVADLSSKLEDLANARDGAAAAASTAVAGLTLRLRLSEADKAAAERKTVTADADATSLRSANNELCAQLAAANAEVGRLQTSVASQRAAAEGERSAMSGRLEQARAGYDRERAGLLSQIESLERKYSALQAEAAAQQSAAVAAAADFAKRAADYEARIAAAEGQHRVAADRLAASQVEVSSIKSRTGRRASLASRNLSRSRRMSQQVLLSASGLGLGATGGGNGGATESFAVLNASRVSHNGPASRIFGSVTEAPVVLPSDAEADADGGDGEAGALAEAEDEAVEMALQHLQLQLARSQGEADALRRTVQDLRSQVSDLQQQNARLQAHSLDASRLGASGSGSGSASVEQLHQMERRMRVAEEQARLSEQTVHELERKLDDAVNASSAARLSFESQVATERAAQARLRDKLQYARQTAADATARKEEYKAKLAQVLQRYAEMRTDLQGLIEVRKYMRAHPLPSAEAAATESKTGK